MSLRRHLEEAAVEVASWPYAASLNDLARDAYAAHRAELLGSDYDPGPWEDLSPAIRDVWIAYVEKDGS